MNRGELPMQQNSLSGSNWGAFDHESHAPQLRILSDNYYNIMHNNNKWTGSLSGYFFCLVHVHGHGVYIYTPEQARYLV